MNIKSSMAAFALLASAYTGTSFSQAVTSEDFTGASSGSWYYFNGACLTAGTGNSNASNGTVAGAIPGCKNILSSYYATRTDGDPVLVGGNSDTKTTSHTSSWSDSVGTGALRFTNGYPYGHSENGAIVSSTPFDAGQGVQITFKTVTYRGDGSGTASLGTGNDGADGMSFYLIDATHYTPTGTTEPWNGIGSWGGSLAYTCSNANPPYDGLDGGYIGLGIDEYGNFLNGSALLSTTSSGGSVGTATGDNSALGYGKVAQRIGLRGAGSVSWAFLTQTYPNYYTPTTLNTPALQQAAVKNTCSTGQVWDYSGSASSPVAVASPTPTLYDYAPIPDAFSVLPYQTIGAEWSTGTYDRAHATPIFYNLLITQDGKMSLSYAINGSSAYTSIIKGRSISSTNAIGSLPATLLFGFAGSSGGSTNVHEIMCFKAAPQNNSSTSAAVSQQLATKIQGGAQIYFSYFDPSDWTGRLTANPLIDTAGVLTISATAAWDAQCNLSGVTSAIGCQTTGVAGPILPQLLPAQRTMLSWSNNDTVTGGKGISFEVASLSNSQQATLTAGDATSTNTATSIARLSYLRGATGNEIDSTGAGLFRARDGLLGDIVDSSPAWVGPPTSPYSLLWKDKYLPTWDTTFNENTGQTYSTFKSLEQGRLNVVYVGANDGFLHGFESGSEDSSGNVNSTTAAPNDGKEVLAYMPGAVLDIIHQYSTDPSVEPTDAGLDYSNTLYAHNFFVDAPPGTGDLYYGGAWHTWLVGGLGMGGSAIFALDVTNPNSAVTNPAVSVFSESNATSSTIGKSTVVGEWSNKNIICNNDTSTVLCKNSLGNTTGTPLIRRLHNGYWGVIFGNGFGSTSGDAGIFVMLVDPTDGGQSFYYLSTGTAGTPTSIRFKAAPTGTSATIHNWTGGAATGVITFSDGETRQGAYINSAGVATWTPALTGTPTAGGNTLTIPNGIAYVTAADLDGDHITDYVYAGDVYGNVWRFDLTGCNISGTSSTSCPSWAQGAWGVTPGPLFTTQTGQPITTPIVLASAVTSGTSPSMMLTFGTGQRTQFTPSTATSYATGTQSVYGIWDWNFTTWNAHSAFTNASLVASTSGTDQTGLGSTAPVLTSSNLQQQIYAVGAAGTIVVQNLQTIAWRNCSGSCSGNQFGWYVNLPNTNEQIVSNPIAFQQAVTVNSTIPASNAVLSCTSNSDQGVTYVFSPITGGTFTSTSGAATSGFTSNSSQTNMVGLVTNETGALTVVNTTEGTTWLVGQSITPPAAGSPPAQPTQITLPPNVTVNRKTWVQLR
jgi:type IV pilus assembly protein PilY1